MGLEVQQGQSYPLGAHVLHDGVNFCVFAKGATLVKLLLFDHPDLLEPTHTVELDPHKNRTHHYWHVFIPGLRAGQTYAYRVHGPFKPEQGWRFDPEKVLLDPYTRAIVGWRNYSREAAIKPGDNCAQALRCVVAGHDDYDWEGDTPLRIPYAESVIYEMHVGGFTRHPSSGVNSEKRGTYAGVIEKIPYLQELGVTAVELLPVHQFDEQDVRPGLRNYWGYSTMAFFVPHRQYSSNRHRLGPLDEFRDMVKALHKAGIEVILDVVFNHSAEGDHNGPTLSFRGFSNPTYYILEADDPALYTNYTGCGNTLAANHEMFGRLILDCLQYWVAEMHVDGFRFDLASVLSRDRYGEPLEDPPILWSIETDPILAGTKLIAEAWDAAGLYQVGSFIGDRFAEWNGPFRDDVRRFVKSDEAMVPELAARILGSPDIYDEPDREPNRSINFVTCHDGFTLHDLVAYNEKHNLANKEDNRDGANDNFSWNCGVEGETDDPAIQRLRDRQMKNLLTILFFSQGTPMILMGDEIRRSQDGNNNGYCQDNELSWFDWSALDQNQDMLRFVKALIGFTQSLTLFAHRQILVADPSDTDAYIQWHGLTMHAPDWEDDSRILAFTLRHPEANEHIHVILNAYWKPLQFELPVQFRDPQPAQRSLDTSQRWLRVIDTSQAHPYDVSSLAEASAHQGYYRAAARSVAVLVAEGSSINYE